MELFSIASGSSGNCICVGDDRCHLMIDAGISGKRIEAGMNKMGYTTKDMDGILKGVEAGNFVKAGWCGCRECEDKIKETTAASARVYAEGETAEKCAVCGKKAEHVVIFARAY